jgi:hypothetical protein
MSRENLLPIYFRSGNVRPIEAFGFSQVKRVGRTQIAAGIEGVRADSSPIAQSSEGQNHGRNYCANRIQSSCTNAVLVWAVFTSSLAATLVLPVTFFILGET